MKIFESKEQTLKTSNSLEITNKLLADNIEISNNSNRQVKFSSKPYAGEIKNNQFEIKEQTKKQNSTKPILSGEVITDYEGTKIRIKANIQKPILNNIIVIGLISGIPINLYVYLKTNPDTSFLYGAILCGAIPIILFISFKYEVKKNIKKLKTLLNADLE